MATVTLTTSGAGLKKAAGQIISFNIGGASIPDGSTINGITVKPTLARSSTGPTASELYGLSTWTANSFAGSGFEVRILHNGSSGILYWEPTGTEVIVDFTAPIIPRYDNSINRVMISKGRVTIKSGQVSI